MTLNNTASKMAQTVLKGLLVTIPFAVSGLAQNCSVSFVPQNITIPASAGSGSFAANVSGLGTCPFTGVGSPSGWLSLNSGNGASTSSGAIVYGFTFGAGAAQPRTGAITVVGGSSSNPGLFTNYLIQILQKGSTFTQLFDDVPSTHAFGDYINLLKGSGVTNGCSATSYCPEASVTREQIAKFIILSILGTDTFTYQATPYFDDVPAGNPLFKYIQKMKELGITSGCSATPALYCPTDVVTRGQTAVFLMRGKFGAVNANSRLLNSTTPYFTDVTSADSQYSFIQKLKDSGITSGCSTTQYCPTNPLTRGQAAVMIIRSYFTPSFAL